jgi:hypothetical protein
MNEYPNSIRPYIQRWQLTVAESRKLDLPITFDH